MLYELTRRSLLMAAAAASLTLLGTSLPALAAEDTLPATMEKPDGYPARPITAIVPYGPGGGSGQYARAQTEAVTELTGVAFNPEYKPGGSGIVGLSNFMPTPSDGYTVLEHIDDLVSAYASGATDVNPTVDLIPLVVAQITFSQIFIRSEEDRFTDWDSFIEYVKSKNGEATIANVSAEGSMERINLKLIMDHYGTSIQQISFDKGGPRYAALKGGQVDALFEQPGDVVGFLDSGDFKPILTLYPERVSAFPDVPALPDKGMTFQPLLRFRGFYVKNDVPADRLEWLQWAFQKSFFLDSYQEYNKTKFMDLIDSFRDTEGAIELINSTADIYRKVYKEIGLIK